MTLLLTDTASFSSQKQMEHAVLIINQDLQTLTGTAMESIVWIWILFVPLNMSVAECLTLVE